MLDKRAGLKLPCCPRWQNESRRLMYTCLRAGAREVDLKAAQARQSYFAEGPATLGAKVGDVVAATTKPRPQRQRLAMRFAPARTLAPQMFGRPQLRRHAAGITGRHAPRLVPPLPLLYVVDGQGIAAVEPRSQ